MYIHMVRLTERTIVMTNTLNDDIDEYNNITTQVRMKTITSTHSNNQYHIYEGQLHSQ